MRLPDSAHTSRPWRIHELTSGFRLEDVWALPTPGGPDDFARLVRLIAAGGLAQGSSRAAPPGPGFGALPFTSLYLTSDEWAAEIINRTVHGVMHIGWVPDQAGGYRGQMAVYVKPNGLLGTGYKAAIAPFRHLIVYPPMLRETGPDHDRTAEQRARAMLDQAPVRTRDALARGWSMLGLRLGSARSDQCVLGWEIRRATPDTVLLGARGRLGLSGELLFARQQGARRRSGCCTATRRRRTCAAS